MREVVDILYVTTIRKNCTKIVCHRQESRYEGLKVGNSRSGWKLEQQSGKYFADCGGQAWFLPGLPLIDYGSYGPLTPKSKATIAAILGSATLRV